MISLYEAKPTFWAVRIFILAIIISINFPHYNITDIVQSTTLLLLKTALGSHFSKNESSLFTNRTFCSVDALAKFSKT